MEKLKINWTQLRQTFRLVQTENICRPQIIWLSKSEIFFRKHCGKDLMLVNSIISFFHNVIHAIIFSDKSGTTDYIFGDLRPFSGTDPPPPLFFFFQLYACWYIALRRNPMVQTVKKKILLIDEWRETFYFCACYISVNLPDFVCRPHRVVAEILIKSSNTFIQAYLTFHISYLWLNQL